MHLTYGDRRSLENRYDSIKKSVEYVRRRSCDDYVWRADFTFGDWLAFPDREVADGDVFVAMETKKPCDMCHRAVGGATRVDEYQHQTRGDLVPRRTGEVTRVAVGS
jgi:hypothetical protein